MIADLRLTLLSGRDRLRLTLWLLTIHFKSDKISFF